MEKTILYIKEKEDEGRKTFIRVQDISTIEVDSGTFYVTNTNGIKIPFVCDNVQSLSTITNHCGTPCTTEVELRDFNLVIEHIILCMLK